MRVEQLRQRMADSEGRTVAPPISRGEAAALLDIAKVAKDVADYELPSAELQDRLDAALSRLDTEESS